MIDSKNNNDNNNMSTPSFDNSTQDKNISSEFNDVDIEDEVPF